MEIALKCLFGWDPGRQRGKRGLFGIMEAFCRADEEQGRGSLHSHMLVFVKNFGHLRRLMFASDDKTRALARASYIKYVNSVMSARQCEFEVRATHACDPGVEGKLNEIFDNRAAERFRDARHEVGCGKVKGHVMKCRNCGGTVSPQDVTTDVLRNLQKDLPMSSLQYPLSKERLDIAAYRTAYDVPAWDLTDAESTSRYILLNERFNQHAWSHVKSCFKKGCTCRHNIPNLATPGAGSAYNEAEESDHPSPLFRDVDQGSHRSPLEQSPGGLFTDDSGLDADSRAEVPTAAAGEFMLAAGRADSVSLNNESPLFRKYVDQRPLRSSLEQQPSGLSVDGAGMDAADQAEFPSPPLPPRDDDMFIPEPCMTGLDGASEPSKESSGTRIYEGKSPIEVIRHMLDGTTSKENRFVIDVERPQGCQYMNVYNRVISYVFGCNSSCVGGDSGQTHYQTLYNTKHTQSEDREARDRVTKNVVRRLMRAQKEKEQRAKERSEEESQGDTDEEEINTWVEGLSRVLSGINAATSRNVISAPMSHNLAYNNGSRFHFSHEFAELLVGQLRDVLDGKDVDFIVRTCLKDKKPTRWNDVSANDYIYRPDGLEDFCYYHQSMHYTKRYKKDGCNQGEATLKFGKGHDGIDFAYLSKLTHPKIPITSIPEGSLCRIEELDIGNTNPSPGLVKKREEYAKIALLMFCPLRCCEDKKPLSCAEPKIDDERKEMTDEEAGTEGVIKEGVDNSGEENNNRGYWDIFDVFRRQYFEAESKLSYREKCKRSEMFLVPPTDAGEIKKQYLGLAIGDFLPGVVDGVRQCLTVDGASFHPSFWVKGFEILQNIEDRLSVEKCHGRATDVLSDLAPPEIEDTVENKSDEHDNDLAKDIAFYCEQFDDEQIGSEQGGEGEDGISTDYSFNRILDTEKSIIVDARVVEPRLQSNESLISDSDDATDSNNDSTISARQSDAESVGNGIHHLSDMESFTTVMRLIQGSLIGGNYEDVYPTGNDGDGMDTDDAPDIPRMQADAANDSQGRADAPTLAGVARAVEQEDKTRLDRKQYIMYEVIACSFLLGLLDLHDHRGDDSPLLTMLGGAIGLERNGIASDIDDLKRALRDRGGRDQLIMFVTGFAGAGKSTAIKVAQRFCYEFCKAASIMWGDNTFLFTAYTGSAAAAFGGLTTVKATYIGRQGNPPKLTDEEMDAFGCVRILIIDEISFLKESELLKLDNTLKKIGERNKAFGGFNVIFSGDFQQNEPVRMPELQKLWHPNSTRHFENNLNCAIILDGIHRFKDDEEYGHILQRLCRGEMREADVAKLNERYVGAEGIDLPKKLQGDTCYACPTNKERNAVTAAIFRDHLKRTHPRAEDNWDPPKHTIIIKGLIESREGSRANIAPLRKRITELGDNDMRQGMKLISPHLCCYNGAHFMCNSNDNLKEHGTGNGTQARLVRVKLRKNHPSYRCEIWDKRKVWTVCASDVAYAEFEHCSGGKGSPKRFRLIPRKTSATAHVTLHDMMTEKVPMRCSVTQLPVNASDAITGHKLQGLTKDNIIVYSWNRSTNWIYTVLSRVRTIAGLYLFRTLSLRAIRPPPQEYLDFLGRMRDLERQDLNRVARYDA